MDLSTTQRLIDASQDVWDRYLEHPFILGIQDGTLDRERFKDYIIQDYLYIREYTRAFALGVAKARTNATMRLFTQYVAMLVDYELDTQKGYISQFDVTEEELEATPMALPNRSYSSYMLRVAYEDTEVETLVAILPCALTYEWIARKIIEANPAAREHEFFGPWVKAYAEDYHDYNVELTETLDALTVDYTEAQLRHLEDIFRACSRYELGFWDMAWAGREAW